MKNKKFFTILFFEILLVCGVSAYFFIDSSDIYKFIMGDTKFYKQSKQCNLHVSSCSINIPEKGEISLDIEPKNIPLMKELTFKVHLQNDISKDNLDLNIYATNMNMGYHTFKLKKISEKTYEAKVILPTCILGNMIWRAEVVIYNIGGAFSFKTE